MENNSIEKKVKVQKSNGYTTIPIRKDTKKKISADLLKINKKDFGRVVRYDEYLALAISMISSEHLQNLQENSMSHADRLERDYRAYVTQFGQISKDEYLGKRLSGEIDPKNSVLEK